MIVPARIEVPPGIPPDTAPEYPIPIRGIRLRGLVLVIPPGHAGLTGIQIRYGNHPIVPASVADFLIGDGAIFHFAPDFPLPGGETVLIARAYNQDILWPHTFHLFLDVEEVEEMPAWARMLIMLLSPLRTPIPG